MILLQQILNGIAVGGVYSLLAVGWTTVWGIVGMINWTHGEVFMTGAFVGYFFATSLHAPFWVAAAAGAIAGGLMAVVVDKLVYKPLRVQGAPKVAILITALGASTLLKNGFSLTFGPDPKGYPPVMPQRLVTLFSAGGSTLTMNSLQLFILVTTVAVMLALQYTISRTLTGRAMLAAAQDREAVTLMGAPVERLISLTFLLSGLLGGLAGVLVGTLYAIDPYMGSMAGIKGWAAAVLGGVGSISGAMVAGVLLGVVENLTSAYISAGWRDAIAFGIMILTLVIHPSGLLGLKAEDKV
jgi:branched-chain amino acid transport system permease protein